MCKKCTFQIQLLQNLQQLPPMGKFSYSEIPNSSEIPDNCVRRRNQVNSALELIVAEGIFKFSLYVLIKCKLSSEIVYIYKNK